jgi:DNA-binding response OmpR family regulator
MKKKILVVDDELAFLELITARLEASGYEVITAKDGVEGLDKAKNLNPDLVILDILMPKLDGYEVCRFLKFDEKHSGIPIIMLSAKTQEIDKEISKQVRADDYITKPFENTELLEKIRKLTGA